MLALGLLLAACGDDDDAKKSKDTQAKTSVSLPAEKVSGKDGAKAHSESEILECSTTDLKGKVGTVAFGGFQDISVRGITCETARTRILDVFKTFDGKNVGASVDGYGCSVIERLNGGLNTIRCVTADEKHSFRFAAVPRKRRVELARVDGGRGTGGPCVVPWASVGSLGHHNRSPPALGPWQGRQADRSSTDSGWTSRGTARASRRLTVTSTVPRTLVQRFRRAPAALGRPRRRSLPAARALAVLAVPACLLGVIPAQAGAQGVGATACPASFQVEHNDRIGRLSLPEGAYRITVLDANLLSCATASKRFAEFLQDFGGRLPRPWTLDAARQTFTRGSATTTGFRVELITSGGGGGGGGNACPYFRVLHNDHIGRLALPAGRYRITLLSPSRIGCARAAKTFAQFLQDFDGRLPRPWKLNVATATFTRGNPSTGFRVKLAVGPAPKPGGGGVHPATGTRKCPGTFQVENDDRIGRLRLPAGPYLVTVFKGSGLSCPAASRRFASFLDLPSGALPRPWTLNASSGTFKNGRRPGFRVKPASVN